MKNYKVLITFSDDAETEMIFKFEISSFSQLCPTFLTISFRKTKKIKHQKVHFKKFREVRHIFDEYILISNLFTKIMRFSLMF